MKKLLLIFIILLLVLNFCTTRMDDCVNLTYEGLSDILLTTQKQVNDFGENKYEVIPVSVTISGPDITDLSPLNTIQTITGGLVIQNNDSLTSLLGLVNLISIDSLLIDNNDVLIHLPPNLTYIGDRILVLSNVLLTNFCSLMNVTTMPIYRFSGNGYDPSFFEAQDPRTCQTFIYQGSDVTLTTQQQVNDFGTNKYILLEAGITITGADIKDLSPLSTIDSIEGDLTIFSNPSLKTLLGFGSSIGGNLEVINNNSLINFCNLSNALISFSNTYIVSGNLYNPTLLQVQDSTTCGLFTYTGNAVTLSTQEQVDVFGENKYTFIKADVTIQGNDIKNLSPLNTIYSIEGDLTISSNDSLFILSGIENLAFIGGDLEVMDNDKLMNFCSLKTATIRFTNTYTVFGNYYNPSLSRIQNLETCQYTGIYEGNAIILRSQQEVNDFGENKYININARFAINGVDITDLSSLNTIDSIEGSLSITFNDSLTNLSGLDNLTFIGGHLDVNENPELMTFSDLANLTSIGGNLSISFNPLTTFSGLESLMSIGGNLSIESNSSLVNYCALTTVLTGFTNTYTISRNGYDPTLTQIQGSNTCRQ